MYTNINELYIWTYIIAGIPLVSFTLLVIAIYSIKYTESINDKRVVRGESILYNLNMFNEDFFLYPYIQTNFFVDSHFNRELFSTGYIFLFPHKEYKVEKNILCNHIGGFNIGIKDFEFRDYFGFFSIKAPNKTSTKFVYVLPKIHYLSKFASVQGNIEEKVIVSGQKGMLEDYTEIESIDEYRPGIPYKKIHWKASAAKDKLYVKEFSHPNDISVSMYVDINLEYFNDEEMLTAKDIVLESALSIAGYCVTGNITCKTLMNDVNMSDYAITTSQDFDKFYNFMAFLNMEESLPFETMMRNYYNRNFATRDVIIVSGSLTDYLMDLIIELKTAGINVILVCPFLGTQEVLNKNSIFIDTLRDKKITVYAVSSADEIGTVLQS